MSYNVWVCNGPATEIMARFATKVEAAEYAQRMNEDAPQGIWFAVGRDE